MPAARRHRALVVSPLLGLLAMATAAAQTSASYHLKEHVTNAGGDPRTGNLTSPSYRVTIDSIGEALLRTNLASASYRADGGFVAAYPPPGEVAGLRFTAKTVLGWNPERSVGHYELYRDKLSTLSAGATGSCQQSALTVESASDTAIPPTRDGYFYLVTARNRVDEEGTKGFRSSGVERPNASPCP